MTHIITGSSKQVAFGPEAIATMATAFELGCAALQGRPEGYRDKLARLIIELAKDGERDPEKLCSEAVNSMLRQLGEAPSGGSGPQVVRDAMRGLYATDTISASPALPKFGT